MKVFEEYIREGIIRKQHIDGSRARSLIQEANNKSVFLQELNSKIPLKDSNANYYIQLSYDIIMEYIRAIMLMDGYSSSSCHEAEISYLKILKISDADVRFLDDLRYYRNGTLYYGRQYDVAYAEKVLQFLDSISRELGKHFP